MKFEKTFSVASSDVDINGNAKVSAYLKYFGETASLHLRSVSLGMDTLANEGKAFFLSRVSISIYAPLREYDEIEVSTWACESRAASFMRCAQIRRGGAIVAEIVSVWALVELATRRIRRVTDAAAPFECEEMLELDLPQRFRIPDDVQLSLSGEFSVAYSVCDRNGHMNNTFYPDVLCDALSSMEGKRVLSFSVHYENEAKLGEVFKVYASRDDGEGGYWFRTVRRDGKTGIEAMMMIE